MGFISNAKLSVKILGSFSILIIAMVVIGGLGMFNMKSINDSTLFIYENNFLSTTYIQNISNNIIEARLYTQKVITEKYASSLEENIKKMDEITADNKIQQDKYLNSITNDTDQGLYDALLVTLSDYRTERENVFELARAGKFNEADTLTINSLIPLTTKVQDAIQDIIDYNLDDADKNVEKADTEYSTSSKITIIILAIASVVAVLIGLLISNLITKGLKSVQDVSEKIADGDLTASLPERYLKQKDEVGILARNIEAMKQGLITTVSGIKNSADALENNVDSANSVLHTLNDRITDTSAATEELSAGMEETGASAEEMNATAVEIEQAVENVAEKAEDGANKSGEIHNRASELDRNVNNSIEKSNQVFTEIKSTLEKALEDSKAVDEINTLADAILGITSQTNLLALNASIEAARAGEAGRGFAVVANEISTLADNSKNTVTQIQAITKVVMSAVNALANSSSNLLSFVAEDVMKDYHDMLEAAKSYNTDAIYMSDMTSDLNATSEELLASVQVMIRSINEVAVAAQEGAKTTGIVAEQTTDISESANTIVENMESTKDTSDQLISLVQKFRL